MTATESERSVFLQRFAAPFVLPAGALRELVSMPPLEAIGLIVMAFGAMQRDQAPLTSVALREIVAKAGEHVAANPGETTTRNRLLQSVSAGVLTDAELSTFDGMTTLAARGQISLTQWQRLHGPLALPA